MVQRGGRMKSYIKAILLFIGFISSLLILSGMGERPFSWWYIPLDILSVAYLIILFIANAVWKGAKK